MELETDRLLREMTRADLHDVAGDPEAMRNYLRPKTRRRRNGMPMLLFSQRL